MPKKEIKKPAKKANFELKVIDRMDKIITLLGPVIIGGEVKIPSVTVQTKKDERFIDNGDGTISDTETGLMWPKEGSLETMAHNSAEKYCKYLNVGGYKDWRLPTVEELFSLVDYTKKDPAINELFKCNSNWYWTSTTCTGGTDGVWMVNFNNGSVSWGRRSDDYYVRPVRQY